jgi:hypothetical protein
MGFNDQSFMHRPTEELWAVPTAGVEAVDKREFCRESDTKSSVVEPVGLAGIPNELSRLCGIELICYCDDFREGTEKADVVSSIEGYLR